MHKELLEVHKELMQYRFRKKYINALKFDIERKRRELTITSNSFQKLPDGSKNRTLSEKIAEILDLETLWLNKIKESEEVCIKIETRINLIKNITEKIILTMYYCQCYSIEEIAVKLNYSYQRIKQIKRNGLQNVSPN